MATTHYLISKTTVGADSVSSITLTNIPQTYTDLLIKVSLRGTNAQYYDELYMQFNNDTGATNYKYLYLDSGAGTPRSAKTSGASFIYPGIIPGANATANTFSNGDIYIQNYTSSNTKSVSTDLVQENNSSASFSYYQTLDAGLWVGTSAITSIKLIPNNSATFAEYTTYALYGIKS